MAHNRVPEAEEILGDKFYVTKNGYVRLIDYLGGDERILQIGRAWAGDDLPKHDGAALRALLRKAPRDLLGMVELAFHVEMPIAEALTFVYARNASVNEYSLRYSDAQDIFDSFPEAEPFQTTAFERYMEARDATIAKELSRAVLGMDLHTRFYWKMNLADVLDFVAAAKKEEKWHTTRYADAILELASLVAPRTIDAYQRWHGGPLLAPASSLSTRREPAVKKQEHVLAPEAEALLDKPIPVLGNGSITLVDYMGSDLSILNAARVSTGGNERPRSDAENRGLINYLRRHQHTTPFEMVELLWKVDVPLFVYRQGGRHRTFERVLCDAESDPTKFRFYHPKLDDIAVQSTSNHQGRGEVAPQEVRERFLTVLDENERDACELYQKLRSDCFSIPLAKRHLPVNRFVPFYFKADLHNALHYVGLRMDSHAQLEIREPTLAMAETIKAVAPWSWAAFETYEQQAMRFSAVEMPLLQAMLQGQEAEQAYPEAWTRRDADGKLKANRERDEFEAKMKRMKDE